MSDPVSNSILDSVARTKVKRDTSVKAVPSTPRSAEELNKRTVRLTQETSRYFGGLKLDHGVSVDGLLEALALYCQSHPDAEQELIESAKIIGKSRQAKAVRDRINTMTKNYL